MKKGKAPKGGIAKSVFKKPSMVPATKSKGGTSKGLGKATKGGGFKGCF